MTNGHSTDDFRAARRQRAELADPARVDRLPPHSVEAEQGALGCVMLSPTECLPTFERQRVLPEWFYDLRHRAIYETLVVMRQKELAIDLITVQQRLRDNGHLESVGGVAYLASLPDAVPSAANLDYYLDILREKFVLRRVIGESTDTVAGAYEFLRGDLRQFLDGVRARLDQCAQITFDPSEASTLLRPAGHFGEIVFDKWFGTGKAQEEPGLRLPETAFGDFPFRIRTQEMTLVLGESKVGKTTLLSYILLHLMEQGMKVVIASMEMAPAATLEKLLRQLLGMKRCPDCDAGRKLFREGLAWLNPRCEILDLRGIIGHRQLLDEFKRAADRGRDCFMVDNLGKIGLMEDDMAAHGQAANEFHGFAIGSRVALFMVNHVNKAGGSRGSLRWTDVADNWVKVEANKKKWDTLGPGIELKNAGKISVEEFRKTYEKELKDWDGRFKLGAQRLDGAVQNAARTLWFGQGSQYSNHNEPRPGGGINWLERWTAATGCPDGEAKP